MCGVTGHLSREWLKVAEPNIPEDSKSPPYMWLAKIIQLVFTDIDLLWKTRCKEVHGEHTEQSKEQKARVAIKVRHLCSKRNSMRPADTHFLPDEVETYIAQSKIATLSDFLTSSTKTVEASIRHAKKMAINSTNNILNWFPQSPTTMERIKNRQRQIAAARPRRIRRKRRKKPSSIQRSLQMCNITGPVPAPQTPSILTQSRATQPLQTPPTLPLNRQLNTALDRIFHRSPPAQPPNPIPIPLARQLNTALDSIFNRRPSTSLEPETHGIPVHRHNLPPSPIQGLEPPD